jgi:signal transduction histidine kinase
MDAPLNSYAIPSLLATILSLMLAGIAWFNHRRDRLNVAFAIFASGLTVFCFCSFLLRQATTLEAYAWRFYLMVALQPLSFGATVYYVLALTGYLQRLDERVIGVSVRHYLYYVVISSLAASVMFFIPGVLIEGFRRVGPLGYDLVSTHWMYLLMVFQVFGLGWLFAALVKAWRAAREPSRRRFIRLNLLGLVLVFVVAILAGILAPKLGFNIGPIFMELSLVLAAMVFYTAVLRYQFDRYEELNLGLERQVDERTRHLRQAQARLIQSEKMASVGSLVAGIVHEVNSPVGALSGAADVMDRAVQRMEQALDGAGSVDDLRRDGGYARAMLALKQNRGVTAEANRRIARLLDSLKGFIRLDEGEAPRPADLHAGLEHALTLLSGELGRQVEVVRDLGDLPPVPCNPAEINQVLMHLLRNAAQALDGAGRITIRTRVRPDRTAAVTISDTGRGMEPGRLERLFDLQLSTDTARVKLGLGLAISHQIVERHGGRIEVESEPGAGSSFTVVLPLAAVSGA